MDQPVKESHKMGKIVNCLSPEVMEKDDLKLDGVLVAMAELVEQRGRRGAVMRNPRQDPVHLCRAPAASQTASR